MTSPTQAKGGSGGRGRTYAWPPQPPHEFEVSSVTTVLSNGLPKPFLKTWGEKMVATYAVENIESWAPLAKADPAAAIDMLKRSVYRSTSEKAEQGTIAHAAIDAYIAGKAWTEDQLNEQLSEARIPLEKWKATKGYVASAMEFLFTCEPEILHNEVTVYSRKHQYAGTTDLILRLPMGGEGDVTVIGDFKTSKSIYSEVGLQLCAYARADFIGRDDGTEVPMPTPIEHGLAIRLSPSGKPEIVPFALSDELFDVFLGCRTVAEGKAIIERAKRPGGSPKKGGSA